MLAERPESRVCEKSALAELLMPATWLLDLHAWAGPLRGGRRPAGGALKRLGPTASVAYPAPERSHQV